MKKIIFLTLLTLLLTSFNLYAAGPKDTPNSHRAKFSIPYHAVEVAPGLFYLGTAKHKGRIIEGYAILMKSRDNFVKPDCGNGVCDPGENTNKCPSDCGGTPDPEPVPDTSTCFEYTKGVKWKTIEPYVVNTSNNSGLDEDSILGALELGIIEWEFAARQNIIGPQSTTSEKLVADTDSPDGINEVYFADVEYPGAIGVTICWGIFRGPSAWKELVEWDQIYDDFDFDWSIDCLSDDCDGKMDFPNIAIHELGHSVGLLDLYTEECSQQTMFGYADYGETNKRTLEDGDSRGISELYSQ